MAAAEGIVPNETRPATAPTAGQKSPNRDPEGGEGINVICRFRPENQIEREAGAMCCVDLGANNREVTIGADTTYHTFQFNRVFPMHSTQQVSRSSVLRSL